MGSRAASGGAPIGRCKSVKTRFLTPLPRFSSILELSLGPFWGYLSPLSGHLGPQDGPKRDLRERLEAYLGVAGLGRNVHEPSVRLPIAEDG